MTIQELDCVMTIINLVEDYCKEEYEDKGIEGVCNTKTLKDYLIQAFDNPVRRCLNNNKE